MAHRSEHPDIEPEAVTTLLLLRHAKALSRESWDRDDALRPLSDKGLGQAEALVDACAHWAIDSVRTSPALRCVQTAQPLCEARSLELKVDDELMEGTAIRVDLRSGVHLLCAHGDNIPHLLGRLGVDWHRCQKASIWELRFDGDGVVNASAYHKPPAPKR